MLTIAGGILLAIFILFTLPFWIVLVRFVLGVAVIAAAVLLVFTLVSRAEEVSEQTKIDALKLGYVLNGHSMVRWGGIDLSHEIDAMVKAQQVPIGPPAPEPAPVKPERKR